MKTIDLTEAAETYVRTKELNPRSRRFILSVPKRLREHLGRPPTTGDLNNLTVQTWLATRAESKGELAVKSDARRCVTLWRWCHDRGWAVACEATPKFLYPAELRKYAIAVPPDPQRKPLPGTIKPRRPAPVRPDRGFLARLFRR